MLLGALTLGASLVASETSGGEGWVASLPTKSRTVVVHRAIAAGSRQ